MTKRFWLAVATLVGSTVGVGIYGIPFVFQKAGFGIGLLFLAGVSGLILLANLLYGEVILRTSQHHQLIGYVNMYLGGLARKINLLVFLVGVYGALIGSIIVSGGFLANTLGSVFNFSPTWFSTIFVVSASVLVFRGLRTVSKFDFLMMVLFGAIILLIGAFGISHLDFHNYVLTSSSFWFLPFGVIMFAMFSAPGIPLVREVLAGSEEKMKKALLLGTVIPAAAYLVFALIVVGVSGESTSPDAVSGLFGFLGPNIVIIASLLGLLTSFTIFINLGTALKESFQEDFHFGRRWAWLLAMVPPYLLFLSGIRNFIDIISLVGGLAISIEAFFLILLYAKARSRGDRVPEYTIRIPTPVLYLMMAVFAAGAAYTVVAK